MKIKKLIIIVGMCLSSSSFAGGLTLDGRVDYNKPLQGEVGQLELYCEDGGQASHIQDSFHEYKNKIRRDESDATNELIPIAYTLSDGSVVLRLYTTDVVRGSSCATMPSSEWCYTVPNGECSWRSFLVK